MKYIEMKGLYTFIKIVFGLIVLVLLWIQWDSYNRSLGNGYYIDYSSWSSIKTTRDKSVFIGGVLEYTYDDKYIIAKRFPRINYTCKSPFSSESYFINKIQYLIISTKEDIMWGGFNFEEFQKKKKQLKINLAFNKGKSRKMRHTFWSQYKQDKDRIEYMKKFCEKDEEYLKIHPFLSRDRLL